MTSQADNIIQETTVSVQNVSLASLSLTSLPESLLSLTHITALRLGKNSLTSLPASLSALTALEDLDVSRNLLTSDGIPRCGVPALPTLSLWCPACEAKELNNHDFIAVLLGSLRTSSFST